MLRPTATTVAAQLKTKHHSLRHLRSSSWRALSRWIGAAPGLTVAIPDSCTMRGDSNTHEPGEKKTVSCLYQRCGLLNRKEIGRRDLDHRALFVQHKRSPEACDFAGDPQSSEADGCLPRQPASTTLFRRATCGEQHAKPSSNETQRCHARLKSHLNSRSRLGPQHWRKKKAPTVVLGRHWYQTHLF